MGSVIIGSLRAVLGLDYAKFTEGLTKVQAQLKRAGQQMQQTGQTLTRRMTLPLVGFGGLSLKVAGDFEASMNRVQAALGASESEFAALRQAAADMGRTTQFTASEAADAIEILAKNGLSAAQILDGALAASLTLAAAGSTDLATAGDIATDVMLAFGKEAKDLGAVVDGVTGVLLSSKFGIDDYRLALGQAGGVAGGLGVELEDFNVALAATAELFSGGSDAGTSFKTFLTRLTPASDAAAAAIEKLGLEFFDAQGNMKSIADISEELKTGLEGLSDAAKTEALTDIFGRDAMRTAIGLANEGADGINRLAEAINNVSATEQAEARMKGFNGEMKKLKSAFEGLLIAIADSGLLTSITGFVTMLTDLVNKLAAADPAVLKFATAFAGLAAVLGPLLVTFGLIATAVAALSAPFLAIVAAVTALTAAVIAFWPELVKLKDQLVALANDGLEYVRQKIEAVKAAFTSLKDSAVQSVTDMVAGVGQKVATMPAVMNPMTLAAEAAKRSMFNLYDAVVGNSYIPDMVEGIEAWMGRLGQTMPTLAKQATEGARTQFEQMQSLGSEIADTMEGSFTRAFNGIVDGSMTLRDAVRSIFSDLSRMLTQRIFSQLFGGLFGGGGGLKIPGFADGTNYAPGGWAVVGERGPEVVNMPRGSQVIPNEMLGGGAPNIVIFDDRKRALDALNTPEGDALFVDLGRRNGLF